MVDDIRLHPGYRESGAFVVHDDIALVITDEPLSFTTIAVKPVPSLSTRRKDRTALKSNNCVLVGFGLFVQHPNDVRPDVLQELSAVNFASNRDCHEAMWKTAEYSLTSKMICSMNGHASACYGDSGGPVGCYDNDGVYYQVGIVSWGPTPNGRCVGQSVYTRVSRYLRWIKYFSYRM